MQIRKGQMIWNTPYRTPLLFILMVVLFCLLIPSVHAQALQDNRAFVEQQYRDFLGREGDAGGIDFWTGELEAGRTTRAQVTDDFFRSAEFQNNVAQVARLYFAYFGRIPDYPGLMYWVGEFQAGGNLNAMSQAFADSAEFRSRYGALNDGAFVDLVYQNVLGRLPDAGGRAFWVSQLAAGMSRGAMMIGFSESEEYRQRSFRQVQVTMMYVSMLRRSPDQAGFDFWVAELAAGGSILTLIEGFLTSFEYADRFSGAIDTRDFARDITVDVAYLALDFEDFADLLREAEFGAEDPTAILPLSVDAGASSHPLVNITRGILNLMKDAGEISIQATEEEFCDVDSVAITETATGYEIVFNQCEFDLFGTGTTYTFYGKVTYQGRGEDGGTLTYDGFRSSLSKEADILTIEANGTIDLVVTNAIVGAGKVTLDLSYDVSVSCGGSQASGSFSYDNLVIEVANDGGFSIGGDLSFSFADADSSGSVSVTIATVEPIRFQDELSVYPSSGKVNATLNGETIAIEYVEGGVWIDGEFVSWAQIEADFDEEDDFDSVIDQCGFLVFEPEN